MAIRRFIILAATCVFAKQSLGPILCGRHQLKGAWPSHLPPAPLIPKLRGHFAEFLFHGSLEHLRLLASPTCVGLRYGRMYYFHARLFLAASSKALGQIKSGARRPVSRLIPRICLQDHTTPLHRDVLHPTALSLPRPPSWSDAIHPAHEY